MMDNKLSELKDALEFLETTEFDGEWDSALVGGENGKNYHAVINANDVVVRAADDSRHTSWLCDYLEAVSPVNIRALLAELEKKDRRIAELEKRLATPVRLAQKNTGWDRDDGEDCWNNAIDACAKELRADGFKVKGDE
ncbi:hypothetical protein [Serratia marcescens]|uniref:hypothetical protein n=1 Tax=Serratia marcescens TaxID=615 RepID=UPI000744E9D6|nr:hypothetical protein [Serratia marcescens]CVB25598.1 Uncharacterised protein [Serratia marcescens]